MSFHEPLAQCTLNVEVHGGSGRSLLSAAVDLCAVPAAATAGTPIDVSG